MAVLMEDKEKENLLIELMGTATCSGDVSEMIKV